MKGAKYTRVIDYIHDQPTHVQTRLQEMRRAILAVAPEATELINYNIPAFALIPHGKREAQIFIAGYARHVGLYPHPSVIEHFIDELRPYKVATGSVQFPHDAPLPCDLIKRMVHYRKEVLSAP